LLELVALGNQTETHNDRGMLIFHYMYWLGFPTQISTKNPS